MKSPILLLLLAVCLPGTAFAISEQNYRAEYARSVDPYFSTGIQGTIQGKNGIPLRYVKFEVPNEKGAIVLVPGRAQYLNLYAELAYDIRDWGYSLYIWDHRGQGFSGRILKNPQIGYVDRFQDYVDDMTTFMNQVVLKKTHPHLFLLGHSMGGNIATQFAEQFPRIFERIVLSAPMEGIDTGEVPEWLAEIIVDFDYVTFQGENYAPTQDPYDPNEPFDGNDETHSLARFEKDRELIRLNPQVALGGASSQWLMQAFNAGRKSRDDAEKILAPILLLQASGEEVVDNDNEDQFCEKTKLCRKKTFQGSRHDILMESDKIRDEALGTIRRFLEEDFRTTRPAVRP